MTSPCDMFQGYICSDYICQRSWKVWFVENIFLVQIYLYHFTKVHNTSILWMVECVLLSWFIILCHVNSCCIYWFSQLMDLVLKSWFSVVHIAMTNLYYTIKRADVWYYQIPAGESHAWSLRGNITLHPKIKEHIF